MLLQKKNGELTKNFDFILNHCIRPQMTFKLTSSLLYDKKKLGFFLNTIEIIFIFEVPLSGIIKKVNIILHFSSAVEYVRILSEKGFFFNVNNIFVNIIKYFSE